MVMNKKAGKRAVKATAGLLCTAMLLFTGCGAQPTAQQSEQETKQEVKQEQNLQKVTVGEVAHSILTPPSMLPRYFILDRCPG